MVALDSASLSSKWVCKLIDLDRKDPDRGQLGILELALNYVEADSAQFAASNDTYLGSGLNSLANLGRTRCTEQETI